MNNTNDYMNKVIRARKSNLDYDEVIFRYVDGTLRMMPIKYEQPNIEEFDKKTKELKKQLSEEQKEAISSYVGIGHREINETMAYGEPKEKIIYSDVENIQKDIKLINQVMEKSTVNQNIICYRGDYLIDFNKYKVGDIIPATSYTSTTFKERLAVQWSKKKGPGGNLMEIRVKKGTNGIYAGDNFSEQNEFELILSQNINFKLVGITKVKDENYGDYNKYIVNVTKK